MDIFGRGRGDNTELTLRPAIPSLRNIVIGVAVVLVALFLLSFAVRITRIEAGHVGVEINLAGPARRFGNPGAHRMGHLFAAYDADH